MIKRPGLSFAAQGIRGLAGLEMVRTHGPAHHFAVLRYANSLGYAFIHCRITVLEPPLFFKKRINLRGIS